MNGVPSSDRSVMSEHFMRRGDYLTAVTILYDPVYLTEPYVRSLTWVLDSKLKFERYPCGPNEIVIEIPRPKGFVPHHLPGTNKWLHDYAKEYHIPFEATKGGAETLYPEYMEKLKVMNQQ